MGSRISWSRSIAWCDPWRRRESGQQGLHPQPAIRRSQGRTFIVTGLYRSGTSLVASILQQAGLFIGSEINDAVYEDEEIFAVARRRRHSLRCGDHRSRNANHRAGASSARCCGGALDAGQLTLFDDPRLIVTFRDPVAMAVRTSLSEYQEPMRALRDAASEQAALLAFVDRLDCPNLLLSYEKALDFPQDFIDAILQFCDIPPSAATARTAVGLDRAEPAAATWSPRGAASKG